MGNKYVWIGKGEIMFCDFISVPETFEEKIEYIKMDNFKKISDFPNILIKLKTKYEYLRCYLVI